MAIKRTAYRQLNNWKLSIYRKPLILRGARQVGKTTLAKEFSKSYSQSVLLNLEKSDDLSYFIDQDNVREIIESLFLSYNISTEKMSDTLLFIDEIQESPKTIQLLRYFYEELPELHVIAAGSLLEFAIKDVPSFPVGRVEFLYLYPLNFMEYIDAIGHTSALEQLNSIPLNPIAHRILLDLFNRYVIIGGMPEVIKVYLDTKSIADLPKVYESIWATYKEDVENIPVMKPSGR